MSERHKSSVPDHPPKSLWERFVDFVARKFPTDPPPKDAKEALKQSMKF